MQQGLPVVEIHLKPVVNRDTFNLSIKPVISKSITMKKLMIIAVVFLATAAYANTPPEVNKKVLKAFQETFTRAEDVVWHEFDNYFQVNFWQGDINLRVKYDPNGNVISTIRYYYEKQLPPNILTSVKKNYAGKKIFGVTEVTNQSSIRYVLTLEDKTHWYTVESDAFGNLKRTDKFRKA